MLPFKRTFEGEKQQLQKLNSRLAQYLCRTKQLEQDNAHLVSEIHKLRQAKTAGWEPRYKAEMRDLREMLGQLSMEKSQAEMEREKLWRELQLVQGLCSEQTGVCRDISGELQGCEKELHLAHKTNSGLQQRLFQLESQYKSMEEAHRQEKERLRRQVDSRMVPIMTQTYRGPPVASVEEVQEYARGLSEGWMETFDMYQQKVEEMEQSIRADQAKLGDLQREKMLYASEMDKLRTEAEKRGNAQMRLEEQLMHMQEKIHVDSGQYQMIIEQLEHERNAMADTIEAKMREHQHLLQVKMDLGKEVAAYRALLEGERVGLQDAHPRVNQHQRERIIDIKMPAQPYKPRASILTTRPHTDIRYRPQTTSLSRSPMRPSGSISPSRVIPISVASRDRYQSPESRRDMISFNKARAAASATATTAAAKDEQTRRSENPMSHSVQKPTAEGKTVKIKQVSSTENQSSAIKSSTPETKSVRVVAPSMMMLSTKTEQENKKQLLDEEEMDSVYDSEFEDKGRRGYTMSPSEKKILDSVSVEEIIEKVIKPAGLDAKVCSSGESKIRYHVEKTEQEDGTFKTQIVLESKVEEELDFSEDSALEELMSQGVKKVSLEDIEDTETGSMIKNILSGLQGAENLRNKSVNVEIIEEPVDSYSDEEQEVEEKSRSTFYGPSSKYFQIEELENVPDDAPGRGVDDDDDDAMKSSRSDTDQSKGGSVHVQQVSRHSESSYFSHGQEPHEYFVSTPDDNLSETEDGGGMSSCGHYGIVDDLSDERYYQDESLSRKRVIVEEGDEYKFMSDDNDFVKESFPESIIEEEVCVSPVVQESVLEFLREDSLEPKEQLEGALEKLQSSVSGPLREELAFLTKLNSGLLEEGDDLSEEQIMAAFRSSNLGFDGGAGGGYSFRISKEEDVAYDDEFEVFANQEESGSEITEKRIKLEPSEKSSEASSESQTTEKPLKISQEKRVATIYLESQDD
ncbi:unnamed protein product [Pleuronectes platessa]|uniref:IF rod domain-containing protein n=1 Tax=Pleuronectes platessa TaxID=8262 RepID=A0A9N7W0T0_PLEPL|nr:unnamed protein product [Pleuronectes platessa]